MFAMETLLIAATVAAIAVFEWAALRFGHDSRDGFRISKRFQEEI